MLSLMPNCSRELGAQTHRIEGNLESSDLKALYQIEWPHFFFK